MMSDLNSPAVMCRHVFKDFSQAKFVCRDSVGWSAGCSHTCLEKSGPAMLSMVGLHCFSNIPELPDDFHLVPSNFAYHKQVDVWGLDYFSPYFEPEEGELIAAPEGHVARHLNDEDNVNVLRLPGGELATVHFDDGVRCLPFWMSEHLPAAAKAKCDGSEKLHSETYGNVMDFARKNSIQFLAFDYLCKDYSLAILVRS